MKTTVVAATKIATVTAAKATIDVAIVVAAEIATIVTATEDT